MQQPFVEAPGREGEAWGGELFEVEKQWAFC